MIVTRKQFIAGIEEGIAAAGDRLSPSYAEALREVGRTATRAARGVYEEDFVGCPVIQAGLGSPDGGCTTYDIELFTAGYDSYLRPDMHHDGFWDDWRANPYLLEIVG